MRSYVPVSTEMIVMHHAPRWSRFILLISLILTLATVGCSQEEKVIPGVAPLASTDNPSQVSYHTSIRFSSDGNTRAILTAGRIRTYDAQRYTVLDSGVQVDFYDKLGAHSSRLTSQRARVNDITHDMTAYDSVHIVSDSGTIVDTDSLLWHNQKQTLHSDAAVRIAEKSGRVTTGLGFESDQNLTSYKILHTTIIAPKDALGGSPSGSSPSGSSSDGLSGTGSVQTNAPTRPLPQSNFGTQDKTPTTVRPFGQPNIFGIPKIVTPADHADSSKK